MKISLVILVFTRMPTRIRLTLGSHDNWKDYNDQKRIHGDNGGKTFSSTILLKQHWQLNTMETTD